MTQTTRPLRVLIVDDDHTITKMFGWMLEMLGHESREAHDSRTAIETAVSFRPDLVMLDLGIENLGGYDLCTKMRAMPELKNCVFIAQTGWDQPDKIERSRQTGFHDHWVKPVSLERLEKLLNTLGGKIAA